MDRAKYVPTDRILLVVDLKTMDPVMREMYREHLVCVGCSAAAYYVPPTKKGTTYFGARPHNPGCNEASGEGESSSVASLPVEDERQLSESRFRLRPHRPRAGIANVEDDPTAAPHRGRARSYTGKREGGTATPGVGLLSLLSKLNSDLKFARSTTRIDLPHGYDEVRKCCVNVSQVTVEHKNRRKIYWGNIHFTKPGPDGGARLYTEYGCPNILLSADMLGVVMRDRGASDLEEFAGASFIYLGYLNESKDGKWLYFSPKDPEWFGVQLVA